MPVMIKPRLLRDYQLEAVAAVQADWAAGITRVGVALPTGAGKSTVIGKLISDAYRGGGQVVALAHRGELLEQMRRDLLAVDPAIDPDDIGIVRAEEDDHHCRIVFATLQTLAHAKRRRALGRRTHIFWDEVHHSGADGYHATFKELGGYDDALMCGFTATMHRSDKSAVGLGDVMQKISYERDLNWAIEEGWLVRPHGLTVRVPELDRLDDVRIVAGDYHQGELAEVMEAATEYVVDAIELHAGGRKSIVFAASVEEARRIAYEINLRGNLSAGWIVGGLLYRDRTPVYAAFRGEGDWKIDVLVTVMVLTEGADFPMCDCVVIARPTRSRNLYCFDSATEILTPDGWKLGSEVSEGSTVAAFDTNTGEVRWETTTAYINRLLRNDEKMVNISSPTVDFRVTTNHRMIWKAKPDDQWRVSEAWELAQRRTGYRIPVAGMQKAKGVGLSDAEIAFIGWVETDGHINRHTGAIGISQQDPENCVEIERVLTGCGFKWRVSSDNSDTNYGPRTNPLHQYRVSRGKPRGEDKHLRGWGALGLFIPKVSGSEAYTKLDAMDERQWSVFLDATHRANGNKQEDQSWTRRSYHICTPRKHFADWMQSMCVRRGWRSNVAVYRNKVTGQDIYAVHCRQLTDRTIGGAAQTDRQHIQVRWVPRDEMVWCVSVPSGAVIVRRNGKAMVSGNSQMIGRALRLYPGKTDALVLDLSGSTRQMKLVHLSELATGVKTKTVDTEGAEVEEEPEEDTTGQVGVRVRRQGPVDLVRIDLFAAENDTLWLQTPKGVPFVPLRDGWIVFLWLHEDEGLYEVGAINTRTSVHRWDEVRRPLLAAIVRAQDWAVESGFELPSRNAPWHKANIAPSQGQVDLARRLKIPSCDRMTRGCLSDEISIVFAARVLDRAMEE